jgi:excisionase family DNA binding protein
MSDKKESKSRSSADHPDTALPPKLRRELAARALLGALDEYVREVVRDAVSSDGWIDQHASPLGKRAHLEAVRRGDLRGTKHGRRVLVRRSELDAFLESHPARRRNSANEASDGVIDQARATEVAAKILADMGLRLRPG